MFMHDASHQYPDCVVDPPFNVSYCGFSASDNCIPLNGCGTSAIFPFIVSFVLIVSLVVLNLIVAIVLDTYDEIMSEDNIISTDKLTEYLRVWSTFDPEATKLLETYKVPTFLKTLSAPLGCEGDEEDLKQILMSLNLYVIDDRVHFRDILVQLAANAIKRKMRDAGKREFFELPEKSGILGRHSDKAVLINGRHFLSSSNEIEFPDSILTEEESRKLAAEKHQQEIEEAERQGKLAIKMEKQRKKSEIQDWKKAAREVEKRLRKREDLERKRKAVLEAEKQMRENAAAARLRRLAQEEEEERIALEEEEAAEKRRLAAEVEAALRAGRNPQPRASLRRSSIMGLLFDTANPFVCADSIEQVR
jgi:hypothetical protein